jgi:hypothetical protein
MQRWTSDPPLVLPIDFANLSRLDLEFENVRRDAGTFTAFVFVNPGGELSDEAGRDEESFAGSFTVFAPATCWGSEGHCDWERGPVSAFDRRAPHHLTPINITVGVTSRIRDLGNPEELVVTVHAARLAERDATEGVFQFDRLTALVYQRSGLDAAASAPPR